MARLGQNPNGTIRIRPYHLRDNWLWLLANDGELKPTALNPSPWKAPMLEEAKQTVVTDNDCALLCREKLTKS